jgi:DNA-binding MarR family transcriptional regulator
MASMEPRTAAVLGVGRVLDLALEEVDLSVAQYRILGYCSVEPATPGVIAQWLAVPKQNLTRQIESLVGLGYLARRPDPEDGRRVRLELTRQGRTVLRQGERALDRYLDAVLEPAEATVVNRGLETLDAALTRGWARARSDRRSARATG